MGGRIAIDFALAYPDMVDRLVLAAPGISGGTRAEDGDTLWLAAAHATARRSFTMSHARSPSARRTSGGVDVCAAGHMLNSRRRMTPTGPSSASWRARVRRTIVAAD
jgi:pimeloyl-ACP methyl ester carboxylesterase